MQISNLNSYETFTTLYKEDSNGREINIFEFSDVVITGESLFYPNTLLFSKSENKLYRPTNESTMSLKDLVPVDGFNYDDVVHKVTNSDPLFFFIYNTDNYYHFLYDTLPYLISFNHLRKKIPTLKLLMNYPNPDKKKFYNFITEFLSLIGITGDMIVMVEGDTLYEQLYVSSSYTHGGSSNLPPRKEIYNLYLTIKNNVDLTDVTPKKIYVSRRSWVHGDFSNIGTNYTTRRKMVNEDELVETLTSSGYSEVFTEKLSTKEKINLFKNAETVIGAIGGGISNVLFSNNTCKLISIVSPNFLEVNERFKYSFNNVKFSLFDDVAHTETGELKTYMRVRCGSIVGEIIEIDGSKVTLSYSKSPICGWNDSVEYSTIVVDYSDCEKLDSGLNSPWSLNINKFKNKYLIQKTYD
tara:strand:+ start:2588 stop:3820 length:1233 start_codon:yes stop_codon:yes gene_type:complete